MLFLMRVALVTAQQYNTDLVPYSNLCRSAIPRTHIPSLDLLPFRARATFTPGVSLRMQLTATVPRQFSDLRVQTGAGTEEASCAASCAVSCHLNWAYFCCVIFRSW